MIQKVLLVPLVAVLGGCFDVSAPGEFKCSRDKTRCQAGYECDKTRWVCVPRYLDAAVEGDWEWVNGATFSYKNWCAKQGEYNTSENCANMHPTGCWNDNMCDNAGKMIAPYVCERIP